MRDIKELYTEDIAIMCQTEEEFTSVLKMLGCAQRKIKDMVYQFPRYSVVSIENEVAVQGRVETSQKTIYDASDYLTQTPNKYTPEEVGLLDMFAGQVMQGIVAVNEESVTVEVAADVAYAIADAMIKKRRVILGS